MLRKYCFNLFLQKYFMKTLFIYNYIQKAEFEQENTNIHSDFA